MSTRHHYTCAMCGSADVQVTAWVHANRDTIVDGEPPTNDAWCPHCELAVELESEVIEEVDPGWWVSNGCRCNDSACVVYEGCASCALYLCAGCGEVRPWDDGGTSDLRCDACVAARPAAIPVVLDVVDIDLLVRLIDEHAEVLLRERAVLLQRAAYNARVVCASPDLRLATLTPFAPDAVAMMYASARRAVAEWIRVGKIKDSIRDACARREKWR